MPPRMWLAAMTSQEITELRAYFRLKAAENAAADKKQR